MKREEEERNEPMKKPFPAALAMPISLLRMSVLRG